MVAYPNEGKIVYGIVVGGNDSDPDPTQSGGCRIYLPTEYGKDVNLKHLPFSRTMAQGNQHGITTFNPPPEHGSAVMCMKMPGHSGSGHLTILGAVPNDISKDSTIPGNSGAPFSDILGPIFKATTGISVPPDITSGGEGGSKRIKEKGKKHSHDLVKFLPSSGTLWPMNGFKVPQSKNIATATQAFSSILSGDMLKMLPGMNMTLGSLMSNMPAALKNELFKNIPPEIGGAIDSMSGLMQSMEVSEGGGFSTAAKINPDVFFQNAANVLADARNIYDMVGAFQRLQSDTSLYGLESLPPVNITSAGGPFGDIPMQLDAFGNLTSLVPEPVQKLAETFSSLMSDGAGFPGVFPGANMFGGSAGVMNEMFNRLPAGELTKAVTQMQKNVAAGTKGRDNLNKMLGFGMQGAKLGLGILKQLK